MSIPGYSGWLSCLSALLILLAPRNAWRGCASLRWPQTTGESRILSCWWRRCRDGTTYTPKIEYEYTVEGTSHRGTLLRHGQIGNWSRKQAEQVIAPYPPAPL